MFSYEVRIVRERQSGTSPEGAILRVALLCPERSDVEANRSLAGSCHVSWQYGKLVLLMRGQGGVSTTYRDGLLVLEDPLDYSYLRAVLYFGGTAQHVWEISKLDMACVSVACLTKCQVIARLEQGAGSSSRCLYELIHSRPESTSKLFEDTGTRDADCLHPWEAGVNGTHLLILSHGCVHVLSTTVQQDGYQHALKMWRVH